MLARMHLMKLVAQDMKALGAVAKGQTSFDSALVSAKGAGLAQHAADIEDLFEAPASDPKSEAKQEIWSEWSKFLAQAEDMRRAANTLTGVTGQSEFEVAFRALGQTCTACHEDYRVNSN